MYSIRIDPSRVPKSKIHVRFFSGSSSGARRARTSLATRFGFSRLRSRSPRGAATPSSSCASASVTPRFLNSRSMIASAASSERITGGFIATQPKAPSPSPASEAGGSGQTSVTGLGLSRCGFFASGTLSVGADAGAPHASPPSASVLSPSATAPIVDTIVRRPFQRSGTRERSASPISPAVG